MKNAKIMSIFIMVSISILVFTVFSAINSLTSNPALSLTDYSDTTTVEEKDHDRAPSAKPIAHNLQDLSTQIENVPSSTKIMKVPSIGNSFSDDVFEHFYDVAKSAGVDVVVGVLYMGGASLQEHWDKSQSGGAYEYRKWTKEEGKINTLGISIAQAVANDNWDVIVLQQNSGNSGMYSTFQPYLNNLQTYLKRIATNQDVKFALNMTWAYASTSTHVDFVNYGRNQMTMYNAIVNAYKQAIVGSNINILIPTGTAIQNARTLGYLNDVEQELTRDGYHLDYNLGRLIASYTAFECLLSSKYSKDLNEDVTFSNINSTSMIRSAKVCAKNAVASPFKITRFN
jgi:hypothetical protein